MWALTLRGGRHSQPYLAFLWRCQVSQEPRVRAHLVRPTTLRGDSAAVFISMRWKETWKLPPRPVTPGAWTVSGRAGR